MGQYGLVCWGWFLFLPLVSAQPEAPVLQIRPAEATNRWMLLSSSQHSNTVLSLQASTGLGVWQEIATLHDALFGYPDAAAPAFERRVYRLRLAPRVTTNDWKNQIMYPIEPFRSTNLSSDIQWVKFAIMLTEPARVYYQDSKQYLFHYDFATRRLPPFLGMDYAAFDAVSLYRSNQQVVLGSVLYPPGAGAYPPGTGFSEYGIQFVGLDPYTPGEIGGWFELVKGTIYASNGAAAYYMPTFEQAEVARTNAAAFEALGIAVASAERWIAVNTCYSPGWALGRLKYFPAAEINAAFADGRLRPEDILLTDGVPADTPVVAGIISLVPSTPNSHTALLSQSFGTPFVYVSDPGDQSRLQALTGHKIILRVTVVQSVALVKVIDVEGQLSPALEAELLALKVPEPIQYSPRETFGAISASADTLSPSDIRFFGGKAANYGLLRRWIPTNCPAAIAFSFDLWEAFLDQLLPSGQTLREEINERLAPYTNYPPDIVALKTNLAAIRNLFTAAASFTPAQQQAITNALSPFNPRRNIRFRSSTNVEDSEHFTGAGLYDSYSGCLMDELDGDTVGPCQCDPTESRERGVFRALQKVYASFYNDDAFLERLRHRVDESQVAMGVLVHHSFPDEEELANGVATPRFNFTSFSTNVSGNLVTQDGAVSVTNPDGTSSPEVVYASRYNTSTSFSLEQRSSLVPLGAYVMDWQSDYTAFVDLFTKIGIGFRQFYPAKNGFDLDFEYKKDLNLGRIVKQVREVPQPGTTNMVTAFLIDEPAESEVQQRGSYVFANHRLKSLWNLRTSNLRLSATNLTQGIYTQGSLQHLEGGSLQSLTGPLSSWPNAGVSPSGTTNYWTTGSGVALRSWCLQTTITTNAAGRRGGGLYSAPATVH